MSSEPLLSPSGPRKRSIRAVPPLEDPTKSISPELLMVAWPAVELPKKSIKAPPPKSEEVMVAWPAVELSENSMKD